MSFSLRLWTEDAEAKAGLQRFPDVSFKYSSLETRKLFQLHLVAEKEGKKKMGAATRGVSSLKHGEKRGTVDVLMRNSIYAAQHFKCLNV